MDLRRLAAVIIWTLAKFHDRVRDQCCHHDEDAADDGQHKLRQSVDGIRRRGSRRNDAGVTAQREDWHC